MKKSLLYVIIFSTLVSFSYLSKKTKNDDLDYYIKILNLEKIDFKEVELFFVIEEEDSTQNSIRTGIVFCNTNTTHTFAYSIDLENKKSLKLNENYLDKSHPNYNNRSTLWQIATLNFKHLYEFEKINPEKKGKVNYNIVLFKKEFTELKKIYLKDVSIKVDIEKE